MRANIQDVSEDVFHFFRDNNNNSFDLIDREKLRGNGRRLSLLL